MSLHRFRITVAAATVLLVAVLAVAFFGAPEIGSAYLMTFLGGDETIEANLPSLTHKVALPLLRIGPDDPHERPITTPWVTVAWSVALVAPLLIGVWTSRAPTLNESVARYVVGYAMYAPLIALVVLVVVIGLALPFACL